MPNTSTRLILKKPKTESSIRRVWLPKTVAYIMREWKNHLDIINYYDLVWCARRIKCPILVSVGFVDNSCPPTGIYAFYNELKSDKKIYNKVDYGHGGAPNDYEKVVWKFLSDSIEK